MVWSNPCHLKHRHGSTELKGKLTRTETRTDKMSTKAQYATLQPWLSTVVSENLPHFHPHVSMQQRYDESKKPRRGPVNRRRIRPLSIPGRVVTPEQPTEYQAS
jgi:hypothetical protein